MQRKHNMFEFFEKVKDLLKRYHFEVPQEIESNGESVGTIYTMRNDKDGIKVEITAGRCIVTNKEENSKTFDKLQNDWEQESLDYIETFLK